jgi:hypothetical protein
VEAGATTPPSRARTGVATGPTSPGAPGGHAGPGAPGGRARPQRRGLRTRDWFVQPSPPLGRAYLALLVLAGAALAVVQHLPLLGRLRSAVGYELSDPLLVAWAMAWQRHAIVTPGERLWHTNAMWPEDHTLAFTDALLGYLPLTLLLGDGPEQALLRYNLAFLASYVLAFVGAALLARELGASSWASGVGGAAFAYAPWRLGQDHHLHVLSSGALPLACLLLLRGYRQRRPGLLVAGWLCAAWQVSFSWTIGIQAAYLLVGAHAVAAALWLVSGRPALPRRVVLGSAGGLAAFLAYAAWQAAPYLAVRESHPGTARGLNEITLFSPPWQGLLAAQPQSWVWGALTGPVRDTLGQPAETALMPAVLTVVLAVVGARHAVLGRWTAVALVGAAVTTWLFAMGTRLLGGRFTYLLLHEHAPGWEGIRTPGRLVTLTTLALALLAAAGATALARRARDRTGASRALVVVPLALAVAVAAEGSGRFSVVDVPEPPPAPAAAGPQLHLPSARTADALVMHWSTDGWPRVLNGWSGFTPPALRQAREASHTFPDAASVAALRELGVRTVVVHRDRVAGTRWEQVPQRLAEVGAVRYADLGRTLVVPLE